MKILGGNPSEGEAKAATKAARIRKLAEEQPEMTRAEIAREVESSRAAVTQVLSKNKVTKENVNTRKPPQPTIKLASPETTARNIINKMGREYAQRMVEAGLAETQM